MNRVKVMIFDMSFLPSVINSDWSRPLGMIVCMRLLIISTFNSSFTPRHETSA